MSDSLALPPNTMRVAAKVISLNDEQVTLEVTKFIASGQGVINVLGGGQKITVPRNEQAKRLNAGKKEIEIDLKEKLGLEGSSSSYIILRWREQ